MQKSGSGWQGAGLAAVFLSAQAHAGQAPAAPTDLQAQLAAVMHELAEQRREIDALRRDLAAQRGVQAAPHVAGPEQLASTRGTGNAQAPQAAPQTTAPAAAPRPLVAAVGKPPGRDKRPPQVAPLFEQPGVLTPRGKVIVEPGFQFGYASSNRVALVGYTVIPALLIGLVDVREVKRNTSTASLTVRTGITNRLEAELRAPYVYRSDSTVSREIFTGTSVERVFDTSGRGAGDAEIAARYQINNGGPDQAYYVGGLRFKSRTGRDPFEVVTDCTRRCIGDNATGTGLPLELPTGSGFYSLQPSLTWLFPSDPAVFFGSVSYLHNVKRSKVSRTVLNGEQEFLGEVKPGDIFGFNFGMGLALNDKASFSLGYDHNSIARTRQGGAPVPGSVRTQLGTLLVGYSYRLSDKRTLNVSLGAGLTRDTPDVSLSIRIPTTY
ncbi:acetate kinase [Massilia soli]|uniref:acetate kinase n=1 Tax=Massilia soli TaxID=2792854 RepID=UPI001CBB00A0|nr:acetate kinase [Massilia soli]